MYRAVRRTRSGVIFDVGAHYGTFHARFVKSGWSVYAFEPDPANRAKIPVSPRVHIVDAAVSDETAPAATFYTSPESTGISSLTAFTPDHVPTHEVRVITLRDFVARCGVAQCNLLKVDTEGNDLLVLKGFPWEVIMPDAIMCEFEDRKSVTLGYTYEDLGQFLVRHGYAVYMSEWAPIVRYGSAHRWRRLVKFPAKTLEAEAWGNFLAFRNDVRVPGMVVRASQA